MRIVTTPLQAPLRWPEPRSGGVAPELLDAFITAGATNGALERLRDPAVVVVTTGQQPGLLTGPLYTIHKALSAVALARLCEKRWKRPVVPVFWAAGGDHDFAEGNHASWIGADGSTVTGTLRERAPDAPLTPLYREPVGPEIGPILSRLGADLAGTPFGEPVLELFRRWYRPEATLASSCAHTIAELLAPFDLVVFDATHSAAKRSQIAPLRLALERAESLDRLLAERNSTLSASGRDPGVSVGEGASLVMLEGRLGRDRLIMRDGGFVTRRSEEWFSPAELDRLAAEEPERFSPNVLLRPAIESFLLPTVAYMAGPGELRYFPLAETVYPPLGIPQQLPLPRWSGVLVDARVDRVLNKFHATLDELLQPGQRLEARVVRDQVPAEATEALAALRESIRRQYQTLAKAAAAIDPTIEKTIQNLASHALTGTDDAEKRLLNHLKKRQVTETQQIARAREQVFPLGKPQERVLTIASFLAREGFGLFEELTGTIQAWYAAGLEGPPERP